MRRLLMTLLYCIHSVVAANAGDISVRLEELPGSKRKQAVTEAIIDAPADKIWAVITDYANYKDFMPRITKSDILEKRPEGVKYFSYVNMPFPISDVNYQCDVTLAKDHRALEFKLVPGTGKGVKSFAGNWKLQPVIGETNKTRTTYTLFYEAERQYPQWAENLGLKHTIGKILAAVRDRVKQAPRVLQD